MREGERGEREVLDFERVRGLSEGRVRGQNEREGDRGRQMRRVRGVRIQRE